MSKIVRLNSKEKNLVIFLLNADKPLPLWRLTHWMGCSSKTTDALLLRIEKGIGIFKTKDYEFSLVIDESKLQTSHSEKQDKQKEQGKLFL